MPNETNDFPQWDSVVVRKIELVIITSLFLIKNFRIFERL